MSFSKFLLFILISSFFEIAFTATMRKCTKNLDCKESEFCYTFTNYCAPCQKDFCKQLEREESQKKCPHEYTDCGPCLEGYTTETIHGTNEFEELPICFKIKVDKNEDTGSAMHILVGLVIYCVLVAASVVFMYKKFQKRCVQPVESRVPERNNPSNSPGGNNPSRNITNNNDVCQIPNVNGVPKSKNPSNSPVGNHSSCNISINYDVSCVTNVNGSEPLLQRSSIPSPRPSAPPPYNEYKLNEVSFEDSEPLLPRSSIPSPRPSAPPPDNECKLNEVPSEGRKDIPHTVKETNNLNEANPFRQPNFNQSEEDARDEASSDRDEANELHSEGQPLIEDDETRESYWTPGNEQSNVEEQKEEEEDSNVQKSKRRRTD